MYKILILEDEEWVAKLIRTVLSRRLDDIEFVGHAKNGIEFMELVKARGPDIILADINVPLLSGLDALEQLMDMGLTGKTIIISGHTDFAYVQRALRLGVADYMLKPIDEDNLCSIVSKACRAIEEENASHSSYEKSLDVVKMHLLKQLVFAEQPPALEEVRDKYGFAFGEGRYQCAILKFVHHQIANTSLESTLMRPAMELFARCFEELVKPLCHEAFYLVQNSYLILVTNFAAENARAVDSALEELFVRIQDYDSQRLVKVSMGVGGCEEGVMQFRQSYREARMAVEARMRLGCGRVIRYRQQLLADRPAEDIAMDQGLVAQFKKAFYTPSTSALQSWLHTAYTDYAQKMRIFNEETLPMLDFCHRIVDLFFEEVHSLNAAPDIDRREILEQLDGCETLSELREKLEFLLGSAKEKVDACLHTGGGNATMRKAIEYIDKHLTDNFGLDDVAAQVNLSAGYFSDLFRQETGLNYKEYVIKRRMQIAMELLKSTSLKINEVAMQSGYGDAKHFAKSFKKQVGISPKEYRRIHW